MKIMAFTNAEEGIPSTAIREIALLKSLDHPNVIKLHKIINEDSRLHLVFDNGNVDLKKFMDDDGGKIKNTESLKIILF
jgi:serine/threonine protein kinase